MVQPPDDLRRVRGEQVAQQRRLQGGVGDGQLVEVLAMRTRSSPSSSPRTFAVLRCSPSRAVSPKVIPGVSVERRRVVPSSRSITMATSPRISRKISCAGSPAVTIVSPGMNCARGEQPVEPLELLVAEALAELMGGELDPVVL